MNADQGNVTASCTLFKRYYSEFLLAHFQHKHNKDK